MRRWPSALSAVTVIALATRVGAQTPCPPDSVRSGTVCADEFEASVWRVPDSTTTHADLVEKIERGIATRADLAAARAVPLGTAGGDYAPCGATGQGCTDDVYAVSAPSLSPAAFVTWFQAQEACANSGKRLPTNAEWQVSANGTPDPGPDDGLTDCNTAARGSPAITGERSRCVSARGARDMVGNLGEWVADWEPLASGCPGWASFSGDRMCLAGASATRGPAALVRGGSFVDGTAAGPLAVVGDIEPTHSEAFIGFRCVRDLPEPSGCTALGVGAGAIAALARMRHSRRWRAER